MEEEEEYFEDVIDGRGEDDGLLSYAISQAKIFSEGMLGVFPMYHSELPQDHVHRMRTIIKSCSFIGFRRGYLQGHSDAKQQEDAENN